MKMELKFNYTSHEESVKLEKQIWDCSSYQIIWPTRSGTDQSTLVQYLVETIFSWRRDVFIHTLQYIDTVLYSLDNIDIKCFPELL